MMARLITRAAGLLAAIFLLAPAAAAATATADAKIPAHPSKLKFGPLEFQVPEAAGLRHELSNGIPVYVMEDRDLPLVSVSVTMRVGSFLDGEDQHGIARMTGSMMRQGGTASLSPEQFDERADFLAASISSFIGDTRGGASLNCITPVLSESLDLLFEMMQSPAFDEERLAVEKSSLLEEMKQRNDNASGILSREWDWLLHGSDHFSSRRMTESDVDNITRERLVEFHRLYWRPDLMIIGISGDVDTEEILADLERRFADWSVEGPDVPWPPAAPEFEPVPGVYHVEKDIPQGKVNIGHLGLTWQDWADERYYAALVMNDILGGGGFSSRIVNRIRSDEGLAYSAGSSFSIGELWPGEFRVSYQSKNSTVALAAAIAFELIGQMQRDLVSGKELSIAKNSLIDSFPRRFESPARTVATFVDDEYIGRPHSYWTDYRERIRAVTREDVRGAAKEFLNPERALFLVVGKWDEIAAGDADGRADMSQFGGGEVRHLPLRDPLTLEPLE
jgi:predicted Zn-dependent peptidase